MSTTTFASVPQLNLIRRLRGERGMDPLTEDEERFLSGGRHGSASAMISDLLSTQAGTQQAERPSTVSVTEPGVYERDGVVYVVKPNREGTKLYAKQIVEIGGTRVTEAGTFVAVEFQYAPGAVYDLTPEDRMTGDRAKELTLRYGKCINCGRDLKAGESVEQGIGPKCVERFPDLLAERKAIKARARAEAKSSRAAVVPFEAETPGHPVEAEPEHEPVVPAELSTGGLSLVEMAARITGQIQETVAAPEHRAAMDEIAAQERSIPLGASPEAIAAHVQASVERGPYPAPPTPYTVRLWISIPNLRAEATVQTRGDSATEAVANARAFIVERLGGEADDWHAESVEVDR